MKTAEQYIPDSMPCCDTWRALIKEIQLDAFKAGALWANSCAETTSESRLEEVIKEITELPPNL